MRSPGGFRRAARWAGVAVFAVLAGAWVFYAAAALRLPGGGFKIPLWVPLLAAVILWVRWRSRAEQVRG